MYRIKINNLLILNTMEESMLHNCERKFQKMHHTHSYALTLITLSLLHVCSCHSKWQANSDI